MDNGPVYISAYDLFIYLFISESGPMILCQEGEQVMSTSLYVVNPCEMWMQSGWYFSWMIDDDPKINWTGILYPSRSIGIKIRSNLKLIIQKWMQFIEPNRSKLNLFTNPIRFYLND